MQLRDVPPSAVVVGVDGSEDGDRALWWAAEQAERDGGPLVLLAAQALPIGSEATGAALDWALLARELDASLHVMVTAAGRRVRAQHPGLDVQEVATVLDPRSALLDAATRARLLVLGSRGRGPVASLLLGSVSRDVSAHASCPVVVVRPGERRDTGATAGVVAAIDDTSDSRAVLEVAVRLAESRRLPLRVVHCFWDVRLASVPAAAVGEPDPEDLALLMAEAVAGLREDHPDVAITLDATHGLVDQALHEESRDAALLVVGRHRPRGLRRLLYVSVATAVLERADCPVVVVPCDVG